MRNATPDEQMQKGTLQAVARYKVVPGYRNDLSNYPPDGAMMKEQEYSYSVSERIQLEALGSEEPEEILFEFKDKPVPVGIADLTFQVVFKGTLGNEKDIAVAVGMKDLNEPGHHALWNSTDRFVLDGRLYSAQEIKDNPDLARRVDRNGNGIYNETWAEEPVLDPYPVTVQFGFSNEDPLADPEAQVYSSGIIRDLRPGSYGRVVILTDADERHHLVKRVSSAWDMYDSILSFGDTISQEDPDGTWQTTPLTERHRGVLQHAYSATYACYPEHDGGGTQCPYLGDQRTVPSDLTPSPVEIHFP